MTLLTISCPSCTGAARLVRETVDFELGRRVATIEVERYRCEECDEIFYSSDQADDAQRAASDELRRQEDLLGADAIKAIRAKFGLTQSKFEQLLGVGPKTVARWERGTVFQNRATDRLLRVLAAVPAAYEFLARSSGITGEGPKHPCKVVPFTAKTVHFPLEAEVRLPEIPKEALK